MSTNLMSFIQPYLLIRGERSQAMNVMTLGNMRAKIEFDQDTELFCGEILGLTGSADFYGKTVAE